jgi:hypothetical protein
MSAIRKTILAASCLALFAGSAYADSWLKGAPEEEIQTLAKLQPGLGTVMIEYSRRFSTTYYAAKGGNWGLAGYQLKEMREIQEVGEATRPAHADALKVFEKTYLDPIEESIKAKDHRKFDAAFKAAITGCDGCHAASGYPFIKYVLPRTSPSPLSNKP